MPGRILQDTQQAAELFAPFGVTPDAAFSATWAARYNVAPTQKVAVIAPGPRAAWRVWGMNSRGGWRGAQPFARCEGIIKGKTEVKGRCIVPITGWYEWVGERSVKRVYCVQQVRDAIRKG